MRRISLGLTWAAVTALTALVTGAWSRRVAQEGVPAALEPAGSRPSADLPVPRSPLRVRINHDAHAMLRCYVTAVPGEITLLGAARASDAGDEILVEQFLLPAQRVSSAHTEVSEEALARLLVEAVQAGIDTSQLRVWLHSHGKMEVFFSGTDESSMDTAFPQADWQLSIVTNRAGDIKARLCMYRPFRIELDDLPVSVSVPLDMETAIRGEVRRKVLQTHEPSSHEPSSHEPSSREVASQRGEPHAGASCVDPLDRPEERDPKAVVQAACVVQELGSNGDRCYRVQLAGD